MLTLQLRTQFHADCLYAAGFSPAIPLHTQQTGADRLAVLCQHGDVKRGRGQGDQNGHCRIQKIADRHFISSS